MSFTLKIRKPGNVVAFDMSGKLTIGEPVLQLREAIKAQINDGAGKFILNLGDVSYIDSSGLGELVSVYTTVRNKGGDVKLLKLTTKTRDLLQMTKLLTVFDSYDEEAKALDALNKSSQAPQAPQSPKDGN
jgi:anti-sigma B factor antagonist